MTKTLSIFLKKARKVKDLSLRDVEGITGISNSYLSQLERDTNRIPSVDILKKLSDVYNCSYDKLVDLVYKETDIKSWDDFLEKAQETYIYVNKQFSKEEIKSSEIQYLIKQYLKLSENKRKHLINYIDLLLKEERGNK